MSCQPRNQRELTITPPPQGLGLTCLIDIVEHTGSSECRRRASVFIEIPPRQIVLGLAVNGSMSAQTMERSSTLCTCGNPRQIDSPTYELPEYLYTRLSEESSFRIFTLSPGLEAEPIRGTLREISLTERDPEDDFNALSYTWSSAVPALERDCTPTEQPKAFAWETVEKPHTIVVDGVSKMAVTCTVYSAFLRLRSASSELRIFVDAMCIDQGSSTGSLNERASQVRRMGDIYRNAHTVFVDLGDQDDGAVDVLDQIRGFSALEDAVWDQAVISADAFLRVVPRTLMLSITRKSWHALIAFCSRRWWQRLWVLREVLLATQATVFVNRETIGRDVMVKGLWRIWNYLSFYPYLLKVHGLDIPDQEMTRQLNQHCGHPCQDLFNLLTWKQTTPDFFPRVPAFQLTMIMVSTNPLESEIPHDQIYALLGLVRHEDKDVILVDYSLPYSAVLVMFSAYVIRSGELCQVLHLVSSRNLECPTWVMDPMTRNTTDYLDRSMFFEEYGNDFHAGGHETTETSFDGTGMLLSIDGVLFGTVSAVTESSARWVEDVTWQDFNKWCSIAQGLHSSHTVEAALSTTDDFWITICAGGRLWLRGIDSSKLAENAHAFKAVVGSTAMPPNQGLIQFGHYASTICAGRRFAMTEEGSPALVPGRVQPGDKVAVFLGCPMPFVIRPTTRGRYRFVGSAYVHGFMDGEALQTPRETFVLE
jgi:hypothetical protein